MPDWHVGQKIVCINAEPMTSPITGRLMPGTGLKKNHVYTIAAIAALPRPHPVGFKLVGLPIPEDAVFYSPRFRPLVERKTDIGVFTAMLNQTPVPALADTAGEGEV